MGENYWSKYKHYFINKVDHKSFSDINLFFDFASEIQEQQLLLKQLQKEGLVCTQKVLSDIESQLIAAELNPAYSRITPQDTVAAMNSLLPQDTPENVRSTFSSITQQFVAQNPGFDLQQTLIRYNQQRQKLETIIDQNVLTHYTPVQIRISIEKILKEYSMLNVLGNSGYQKLSKLSRRKF